LVIDDTEEDGARRGQRDDLIRAMVGNPSVNGPHLVTEVRAGARFNDAFASIVVVGDNRYRIMANTRNPNTDPNQPTVYQIRIKGHLGRQWTDWFGGLSIMLDDNGDTLLTGSVVDQAALHGVLRKVRDLGMPLLSVNRVEPGQADGSDVKEYCEASC
jgi:hypothetical protein